MKFLRHISNPHALRGSQQNVSRETSVRSARIILHSTGGFTIGEVLVTVALVGLLTMAVAAGIGVAVNAYGDIKGVTDADALMNNAVTAVEDELRFAYDIESLPSSVSAGGIPAYAFDSSVRGYRLYLSNQDSTLYLNAVYASTPDNSTQLETGDSAPLPLLKTTTTAGETGATITLTKLEWNSSSRHWTFALETTNNGYTATSGDITVRPINNW